MREIAQNELALAFEKPLSPGAEFPGQADLAELDHKLDIAVPFTSTEATLRALKLAEALAYRLDSRIALLVPQLVPYPLPLTSPPVLLDFNERRFRDFASRSHVQTSVRIYLCRDRWDALLVMLKPRSLVVIGGRKRWWPTAEARLARRLQRAGHEVVVVEME
jgi:hypothetical protein